MEKQEIKIKEKTRTYDIKMEYHSDLMCQNEEVEILGILEADNRITIKPGGHPLAVGFVFEESDPDRIIAIAEMIKSFAEVAKETNKSLLTS